MRSAVDFNFDQGCCVCFISKRTFQLKPERVLSVSRFGSYTATYLSNSFFLSYVIAIQVQSDFYLQSKALLDSSVLFRAVSDPSMKTALSTYPVVPWMQT